MYNKLGRMTEKDSKRYQKDLYNHLYRGIYDCYKQPSQAKIRAFDECLQVAMNDEKQCDVIAMRYGITGYNSNTFTFVYELETKYAYYIYVFTAYHSYYGYIEKTNV